MTVSALPATSALPEIVGVRFRPGVAPALLEVSASELLNQRVPLRDIWRHNQHQPWADVTAGGEVPATFSAIARLIASGLEGARGPDPLVIAAADWIACRPFGTLEVLSRRSGLSDRQVRRRFDDAIGYGPKTLQRILRIQRLLWLASQSRNRTLHLGRLAFAAGYADQAHMTREVTALTGSTPRRLLRDVSARSAVSDMFKTAPY